jgi:hypothetical protein
VVKAAVMAVEVMAEAVARARVKMVVEAAGGMEVAIRAAKAAAKVAMVVGMAMVVEVV